MPGIIRIHGYERVFDTYNIEEIELLKEVDDFKKRTGIKFPSVCEILKLLKNLGYEKVKFRIGDEAIWNETRAHIQIVDSHTRYDISLDKNVISDINENCLETIKAAR